MDITIAMPQMGLTMSEGTVSAWLKKPGEAVSKDEAIVVISTDKVDVDVESPVDGVLRLIVVNQGQTAAVGAPLGYVDAVNDVFPSDSDQDILPSQSVGANNPTEQSTVSLTPETEPEAASSRVDDRNQSVPVSPRAKRRARQLGIDISTVKGSGPKGLIVEKDLLDDLASHPVQPNRNTVTRRQRIAERMVESIRTIPAFSVSKEVNAEGFVALFESLRGPIQRSIGKSITYTDLLLKALALALAESPQMNSVWRDGAPEPSNSVNIALAVATERGVVAPVLTNADHAPLETLVAWRSDIAERSRQGRLALMDLEGGVGTLSNLGMYPIDQFEGLITPGQSFILSVGRLRNRPWVETSLVIKPTVILTLSVDHRIADGALAAKFLTRISEVIEHPYQILWSAERQ
jgi:pyruvate dehydrogenase E2 component (dihydrolipoamide acetyltransferase)